MWNYYRGGISVTACSLCSLTECQHGGTCSSDEFSSTCDCLPGFEGEQCEGLFTSNISYLILIVMFIRFQPIIVLVQWTRTSVSASRVRTPASVTIWWTDTCAIVLWERAETSVSSRMLRRRAIFLTKLVSSLLLTFVHVFMNEKHCPVVCSVLGIHVLASLWLRRQWLDHVLWNDAGELSQRVWGWLLFAMYLYNVDVPDYLYMYK